tara:strand:+ start:508 stop:876 length:369 start_codon:yes stop_codon:yes gene_type:complete
MENNKLSIIYTRKFWLSLIVIQALTNLILLNILYNTSDTVFEYLYATLLILGAATPALVIYPILGDGIVIDLINSLVFVVFAFYVFRNVVRPRGKIKILIPLSFVTVSLISLIFGAVVISSF